MYGEQMVNGKQLTLTWHVDNMKVSHINKNVVSAFILYLKSVYGEMHESIGKHRDYLGMWLDFSRKGDVQISMEEYLCGDLENVQEVITMTVVIHVGEHLFTIRDSNNKEQVLLDYFRDWDFHHGVVQLLFSTVAYNEEKTCKLQWDSCS